MNEVATSALEIENYLKSLSNPEDQLMDEWIRLGDDELWRRRIAMVSYACEKMSAEQKQYWRSRRKEL